MPIKQVKTIHYEVTFGPKKEENREMKTFSDENVAAEFFKTKEKEGMHVDAYTIETVITKKKLSQ